jgi:TBC1 domain family protein 5
VKRTFPEVDFFREEAVRKSLLHILLIYAREAPHVAYKQGMHELLAPILYVFKRLALSVTEAAAVDGAATASDGTFESFADMLHAQHVEAHAYAAFAGLMSLTQDWFVSPQRKRTPSATPLSMAQQAITDETVEWARSRLRH